MTIKKVKDKVRKLLSLATSSNPHEAALAAEKAREILATHNMTIDSVDLDTEEINVRKVSISTRKTPVPWIIGLASVVAEVHDCRCTHNIHAGLTSFYGVGADADVAGYVFSYLFNAVYELATEHLKKFDGEPTRVKAKARKSYQLGACDTICTELRLAAVKKPVTSMELVPVKSGLIAAFMTKHIKLLDLNMKDPNDIDFGSYSTGAREASGMTVKKAVENA